MPEVIHNGDHLQSILDGEDPHVLAGNMDASVWAEEWMKAIQLNPEIPADKGAMIGWFANAIMAGYDTGVVYGRAQEKEDLTRFYQKNID